MSDFFHTNQPYEIAKGITGGHELANDLVAHVFLIMEKKENVRDQAAMFAGCCYTEWQKPNSSFNKLYRPHYTCEIVEEITEDIDTEWIESEHKKFLREYIEQQPSGEGAEEWYKRQIAKFVIMGMTQKEIEREYGIPQAYVSLTLKQFKKDVLDNYIKRFGSEDIDNV